MKTKAIILNALITFQIMFGQDFLKISNSLLNFYEPAPLTYSHFSQTESPTLSTEIIYSDLYRKISNKQLLSQANTLEYGYRLEFPFSFNSFNNLLQFNLTSNAFKYNNKQDQVAVNSKIEYKNLQPHLRIVFERKQNLVGVGIGRNFDRGNSTNLINSFPKSNNKNLNKYFFDLLQPSFGDSIYAKLVNSGRSMYEVWFSLPLFTDLRFLFYYQYNYSKNPIEFHYQNRAQKAELQGERLIQLSPIFSGHNFAINLILNNPIIKRFQSGFNTGFIDFELINPGRERYDIVNLGSGQFQYYRVNLKSFLQSFQFFRMELGMGAASHTGDGQVATPVLGYYQYILPISHSADGQIRDWKSLSWLAKGSYDHNLVGFDNTLSVYYIHSRNWLDLEATTYLEFGLESGDYKTSPIYYVHLWELGYQFQYNFNKIRFQGKIKQALPIIKEKIKKEKPAPPKPARKYRETGGRFYSLSVSYVF